VVEPQGHGWPAGEGGHAPLGKNAARRWKKPSQNNSLYDSHNRSTSEMDRTGQARTGEEGAAGKSDDPDADNAADYRDWCTEDEREHLEALADRNAREAYER
jgi:hypothetical protein